MNKEDYIEWKGLPLTKSFHKFLLDYRQSLMEAWADGQFSLQAMEASLLKNTEAMAKCQCYHDLANLEADFIENFYK